MAGISLVLDIAKTALAAQQYGIDVTAHNIANVNTPGFSRQRAVFESEQPAQYAGKLLGRGVDAARILRSTDLFIEDRLMQQNSSLLSATEMEYYAQVLEGVFSENSGNSLGVMLSDFWNLWQDTANNPSGPAERNSLYEHSLLVSEQFNALYNDLTALERDLTNSMRAEINHINQITDQISHLNDQIVGMEVNSPANDLRDKRNALVSELAESIYLKSFEQDNGSLTVVTNKGCILVHGADSFELRLDGDTGDRVEWEGSGGVTVDITDQISTGKMGGWLAIRDEVLAKYKLDMDALAGEFIWAVNQQHSQGVGLEAFSTVTGTYQPSSASASLDSSGLSYADKIVDGGFRMWLYDANGNYDTDTTLSIDVSSTSIDDVVTAINAIDPTKVTATTVDSRLQISGVNGYTFAFSDDTSNVLAALGINTYFAGAGADGMAVNANIGLDKDNIAAAQVRNNVGEAVANSSNDPTATGTIVTSGHYTGTEDGTYEIEISTGGDVGVAQFRWRKDGGPWSAPIPTTGAFQAIDVDGVAVKFMPGTYVANDTFSIALEADSTSYGSYVSGDNTNALAMTDLQDTSMDISQWTCDRTTGNTELSITASIEDYYQSLLSSIGVKSASISRDKDFNESMVNELGKIRDSISAVSLDEELTNLIKFQHAYAAATKLISTSEKMLDALLSVK